jgi:hypothetical protein
LGKGIIENVFEQNEGERMKIKSTPIVKKD